MKKLLVCLLGMVMLTGCTKEVEPVVLEEPSFVELYPEVEEEHKFYFGDKEQLVRMIEHGTGVIYFGFPECPWCQAYSPMLNEVAKEQDVSILYYNIYTYKTEDMDFYLEVCDLLIERDATILHYDNEGNPRIYMPLVLFVYEGAILAYDDETCDEDSSVITPEDYWQKEKKEALKERLKEFFLEISILQEEKNHQGCDDGCKVGEE